MKILAVDYGDTRTGVAICDRTEFLASPLGVITEKEEMRVLEKVAFAAAEYGAQMIVVGYPRNMDGTSGTRAKKSESFAKKLKKLTNLPVDLWDERQTTVMAHQVLNVTDTRGKKRKEVVDTVAAVIILESYLAFRKNNPNERSIPVE